MAKDKVARGQINAYKVENAALLKTTDNLQSILDSGVRAIILNPAWVYNFNNINIPSGTKISGNGATITSPDTAHPIFNMGPQGSSGTVDIILDGINFKGSSPDANNLACVETDCGIYLYKSGRVKITNCRFEHFLGAGINCFDYSTNPALIDYISQQNIITGNTFHRCYYGFVNWFNAEYNICSLNNFTHCRCAIWSQSANWLFSGNLIVRCRAGFVSAIDLNTIVTSVGALQHGSFTGNIINHCRSEQTVSWQTENYLINGIDYQGIYINGASGCIPPTFNGNTLYYSGLTYINAATSGMPYWYLTGCVLSNCVVSCNVTAKMGLVACSEQANVTKTNVVSLTTPT